MHDQIDRELMRVSGGRLFALNGVLCRYADDGDYFVELGRLAIGDGLLTTLHGMPDFSGGDTLNVEFIAAVLTS